MKRFSSRLILPFLILIYTLNFMDRSVLGIVGDAIKRDLGLSDSSLGLLHSALLMTLIFLLVPASALCDIFGRRKMVALAAAIWTGAVAFTGLAASFGQLACARAMCAVNDATVTSGGISWLSGFFPAERRGRVLGSFQISSPLGMALGTLFGGIMLSWTGDWRLAFLPLVIPGIICAIAIPRLPDNQPPAGKGYFAGVPGLLKSPTLVLCGLGAGLLGIEKFAYQTWFPVLLLRNYENLSPAVAGAMAGAFLFIGILGPLIGGNFSDWFNRKAKAGRVYALLVCVGIVVTSKFLLYYMIGLVPLYVIFAYGLIDGICTILPMPIYFTMVQDVVEDRFRAAAIGVLGVIVYFGGAAWGPWLLGIFSDMFGGGASGLRSAELALLCFPVLAMLAFSLTLKSYVRDKELVAARESKAS